MMKGATVIYDADCGFCKWCLAVLLRLDRRGAFRPLPLGTAEADRLLADLTLAERDASWHLVVDEGSSDEASGTQVARDGKAVRFSAGAGLAPAMDRIHGGSLPAALFRRFPGASERGYRWVAEHRGLLGNFVGGRARRWVGRVIAARAGASQ